MRFLNLHGIQDCLALLVRRKWLVIVPFFALSGVMVVLTDALPKMFVSESLILIPPRSVPKQFVGDPLSDTVDQRLISIQQTVLSRTILVQILREFEDKLPDYQRMNLDAKVLKITNAIRIVFPASKTYPPTPISYFRITYQNRNPALAQKIAAKLTSLFIEEDNRNREKLVFGTTDFLKTEIEKVEEQMKQTDAKFRELRSSRIYELPNQLEPNLRMLDRLQLQRQSNADAMDRYATIRLNLEREISETQQVIVNPLLRSPGVPQVNPSIDEYRKKLKEVADLSATLKPTHPDVVAATLQLERLRKALSTEELAAIDRTDAAPKFVETPTAAPNPVYQKLTAQLLEINTEFENRVRERTWIDAEMQKYVQRVQNAPQSEQEIADILREDTDLRKRYDSLAKNLNEAELTQSLESRQKGTQFVIADPANYPLTPTKPAKQQIALGGVLLSLVLGLAFGVVVDVANQKMWTQSDVEHLLGVKVLIEIPHIAEDGEARWTKKRIGVVLASSLAAASVYGVGLYLLYVNQAQVIQRLDPWLQRFY